MTPISQSLIPQELGINELIAGRPRTWRGRLLRGSQFGVAAVELARLVTSSVYWSRKLRSVDGHSVLVIPGYGVGDRSLIAMHNWLKRVGYHPAKSGLDFNPGWSDEIVDELCRRAEDDFGRTGRRVTLIGHSLGGLQARSVAQRRPQILRRLIVLGAPLGFASGTIPSSIAFTSIYVSADLPYEPRARESHAENIQVRGSHGGLAVNTRVYALLAELLSRPDSAMREPDMV
jgi:pimeloyl-ACP methyl ester carboxylesterase